MSDRRPSPSLERLTAIARKCRREIVRMTTAANSGHPGGSLSAIDILVALYAERLRVDPDNPTDPARDRFVMSKGHASPALYAILADRGFFPAKELAGFRSLGSLCQGHVDATWTPGVEMSSGSLGMGISFGIGCALSARLSKADWTTFVLIGDGEVQEGEVWEAALSAAHHKLGNLKVIIDKNRIQNDGFVATTIGIDPLPAKWEAFGWATKEVDGHDMAAILEGLAWLDSIAEGPSVLIAHTVKGKGVSFMEDNPAYHGAAATPELAAQAYKELEG
ncbi:transketolase [bacterium]|nr:transketolase [bacterium]